MEELEKVELIREKCNVTYAEAKKALEENGYEVLDAIVSLERKANRHAPVEPIVIDCVAEAIPEEEEPTMDEKNASAAKGMWSEFCSKVKQFCSNGMEANFVAEHNGEHVFSIPVLFVIIGLFIWGATLWLLIIGLFFGFRYHIEGGSHLTESVNEFMGKAADLAGDIKHSVA